MTLVVTSARKRMALAREDVIEKLFFLIDEFIDFENVRTFRLPDMAPEEALLIAFELDSAARRRLQLDHIADLEIRDLAERQEPLFENGLERHFGLLHLGG